MAHQDDGFLREVEEELRRERLEKIWRQYGTYILAAAALIVFGVLGYKYLENSRISAAQSTGKRYQEALQLAADGKEGSATKEFETLAKDGTGGYPSLARLQLAGALLKDGKKSEALAAYEALAKNADADEMLRSYAKLQAAALRLGQADFTEMQNRLNPLIGDESPWRYSARELLGLAAFKAGKTDEARNLLTPLLVDPKAPQTINQRAQIVLGEIATAEIAKKAGNEAKTPAATAAKSAPSASAPSDSKDTKKE
jgi:hypothetical protein